MGIIDVTQTTTSEQHTYYRIKVDCGCEAVKGSLQVSLEHLRSVDTPMCVIVDFPQGFAFKQLASQRLKESAYIVLSSTDSKLYTSWFAHHGIKVLSPKTRHDKLAKALLDIEKCDCAECFNDLSSRMLQLIAVLPEAPTTQHAAQKLGVSTRMVQLMCEQLGVYCNTTSQKYTELRSLILLP